MIHKTIEFATEETFAMYVNQTPLSPRAKRRIIGHEIAHARAAQKLGYQAHFTVIESKILYYYACNASCTIVPKVINSEHLEEMLRAPRRLSPSDIEQLEELRK